MFPTELDSEACVLRIAPTELDAEAGVGEAHLARALVFEDLVLGKVGAVHGKGALRGEEGVDEG